MIKVDNLSYSFPQKDLYNKISFTLEDGQHCAFIGASGSGKSTLIDLIMDPERYMFDGNLEINPDCRIGYVSQFLEPDKANNMTVFEYLGEEFIRLQNELTSICTEMEEDLGLDLYSESESQSASESESASGSGSVSVMESLLEKYQNALDAFDAIGGDDFESNIEKKLNLVHLSKQKNLLVSKNTSGSSIIITSGLVSTCFIT